MKNAIVQAVSELRRMNPPAPAEALASLLPLFDFVSGTAHFPENGKPARYGLAGEQAPPTFWCQLRWPFQGI